MGDNWFECKCKGESVNRKREKRKVADAIDCFTLNHRSLVECVFQAFTWKYSFSLSLSLYCCILGNSQLLFLFHSLLFLSPSDSDKRHLMQTRPVINQVPLDGPASCIRKWFFLSLSLLLVSAEAIAGVASASCFSSPPLRRPRRILDNEINFSHIEGKEKRLKSSPYVYLHIYKYIYVYKTRDSWFTCLLVNVCVLCCPYEILLFFLLFYFILDIRLRTVLSTSVLFFVYLLSHRERRKFTSSSSPSSSFS